LATIFKLSAKIFQNIDKNQNFGDVISHLIFWGDRDFAQGGGEILPKVSAIFQKFTKTARLDIIHIYLCKLM